MEIEQDLRPRLERDRPVFEIMPTEERDEFYIAWEQRDNYTGLQHLRGLDGPPSRVQKIGAKRYLYEPGVYGEFIQLNERELTVPVRALGTWGDRMDLSQVIFGHQEHLLQRQLDRIESMIWMLLTTGTFTITDNGVTHQDSFDLITYDASTWATIATATPLADLRAVALLSRGHSVSFGAGSVAWMNQTTANNLLANRNATDIGGQLSVTIAGVQPLTRSLETINQFFIGQGLPSIRVYDGGYLDDAGVFTLYIPDGKVVLVGRRAGNQQLGVYRFVRNATNPSMGPQPYMIVVDHGEDRVPRTIELHAGHNGGPCLFYPGAIAILDVS